MHICLILYDGPYLNILRGDKVLISRPLRLLVETASAFGPDLAYRLCVAQPTLMDVPRYFLICFYISIYVCVPHCFDRFGSVGCSSSVSIKRIIYKCLNACPLITWLLLLVGRLGTRRPVKPHQLGGYCNSN